MIRQNGLIPVISQAQDESQTLVTGGCLHTPFWRSVYEEIIASVPYSNIQTQLYAENDICDDPVATMLFILRYPKRFSPCHNDKVQDATLDAFLDVEHGNQKIQRGEVSRNQVGFRDVLRWDIIPQIRDIVASLLPWDKIISEMEKVTIDDWVMPSGSGSDANQFPISKLRALSRQAPEFFGTPMGVPYLGAYVREPIRDDVRVTAVPKSFKSSRIIAMEGTVNQGIASAYRQILERYLPECIDVTDQTRNQHYAWLGSSSNGSDSYATIDASGASDHITTSLVSLLFPSRFVNLVLATTGRYVTIRNSRRVRQMFLTSGHNLTFIIETIVYYAIAKYSLGLSDRLKGDDPNDFSYNDVSAYGDDTIVPSRCFDTLCWVFSLLGLRINAEKSYHGESPFRESCGSDYYNGTNVSSLYFPRFPIIGTVNGRQVSLSPDVRSDTYRGKLSSSLTVLIDLQHKLYGIAPKASLLLSELVHGIYPGITVSMPGVITNDLWGMYGTLEEYRSPAGEFTQRSEEVATKSGCFQWLMNTTTGMPMNSFVINTHKRLITDVHFRRLPSVEVPEFGTARDVSGKKALNSEVAIEREYWHVEPGIQWKRVNDGKDDDIRLIELYRYQQFLKHGPFYEDPLSELLGVSTQRLPFDVAFGKRSIVLHKVMK
jgi:hypothetical protein